MHASVHGEGRPVVKFYLLAERQENAALLHHTESDNNRLNHKSHPLLYILHDPVRCEV